MPLFAHQRVKTPSKVHYSQYLHTADGAKIKSSPSTLRKKSTLKVKLFTAVLHRAEPSAKEV